MEELKVKVGDKVLYRYNHWGSRIERIETVVKVTPTGRIRISGKDCQFNKCGEEMGVDAWHGGAYLSIPTEDDYKRIRENEAISKAESIMKNAKLTYDQAVKIIEILEGENADIAN